MSQSTRPAGLRAVLIGAALTVAAIMSASQVARADEGGVSFWIPGLFGSLAAVPATPGFGLATIVYNTSVDAGRDRTFFRGGRFVVGLDADVTVGLVVPSYT